MVDLADLCKLLHTSARLRHNALEYLAIATSIKALQLDFVSDSEKIRAAESESEDDCEYELADLRSGPVQSAQFSFWCLHVLSLASHSLEELSIGCVRRFDDSGLQTANSLLVRIFRSNRNTFRQLILDCPVINLCDTTVHTLAHCPNLVELDLKGTYSGYTHRPWLRISPAAVARVVQLCKSLHTLKLPKWCDPPWLNAAEERALRVDNKVHHLGEVVRGGRSLRSLNWGDDHMPASLVTQLPTGCALLVELKLRVTDRVAMVKMAEVLGAMQHLRVLRVGLFHPRWPRGRGPQPWDLSDIQLSHPQLQELCFRSEYFPGRPPSLAYLPCLQRCVHKCSGRPELTDIKGMLQAAPSLSYFNIRLDRIGGARFFGGEDNRDHQEIVDNLQSAEMALDETVPRCCPNIQHFTVLSWADFRDEVDERIVLRIRLMASAAVTTVGYLAPGNRRVMHSWCLAVTRSLMSGIPLNFLVAAAQHWSGLHTLSVCVPASSPSALPMALLAACPRLVSLEVWTVPSDIRHVPTGIQEASLQRVDMATMDEVIRLTRGKRPNACTARLHVEIPSTAGISPEEKDELELRHPHLRMTLVPADDLSSQIDAGPHHLEEDEPEDGDGTVHGDMYDQQQAIHYMLDEWEEDAEAEAVEGEEADASVEAETVA
eukprot:gene4331-5325_t